MGDDLVFGLPSEVWKQVALALVGGLVVLVGIGLCISAVGDGDAVERIDARDDPTVTPSVAITPTPSRVWTASELMDCDTTTLRRQLDDRARPGELLSDCETALYIAQLQFGLLTSAESDLSRAERAELLEHVANVEELQREVGNMKPPQGRAELLIACGRGPDWAEAVQGAVDYIAANPRAELLGWEVEVLRYQRFVNETTAICARS